MANPAPVFTQVEKDLMRVNELLNKRVDALLRVIRLGSYDCEHLHHEKKHQHKYSEPCPVEAIVRDALGTTYGPNDSTKEKS